MKRSLFLVFVLFVTVFVHGGQESPSKHYAVIHLNGTVNPIIAEFVAASIDRASKEGASFVVIQMDTPGGLMDAMRTIIKSILSSPVPVVVYTYPRGAQAASAGGFIMLSAHIAAMAPGTEIGAMHPVSPMLDFMQRDQKGDPAGVMEKKVLNDTVAYARSLAQKRGRNVEWAEKAVSRAISSTYREALEQRVIDIVADDMADLLVQINNRTVDVNGANVTIRTTGLHEKVYTMDRTEKFLNKIADPQVLFILLILAIAGIGIEFKNPGMIVPGTIGAISLVFFLLGIRVIPFNVLGLILIILAIVLFILELVIISHGLLTAGGILAFILGAMILFDSPLKGGYIPMPSILATMAVLLAFIFLVVRVVIKALRDRVTTGIEGLVGETGITLDEVSPYGGRIQVLGEIWKSVSTDVIQKGTNVEVVSAKGMTLQVKSKKEV